MSAARHLTTAALALTLATVGLGEGFATADTAGPLKQPLAGCATFTDPKGDSTPPGGNDPDLDITGAVFASPPGKLRVFIRLDKLSTPSLIGHAYDATFQLNGGAVVLVGGQDIAPVDTVHRTTSGFSVGRPLTDVTWHGSSVAGAVLDVVFDQTNSVVVLTTDRAPIEKVAKASLADGVTVSGVAVDSYTDAYTSFAAADTAPKSVPAAKSTYTFGDNHCFLPPKGHLALTAPTQAVYGHAFPVTAVLTDDASKAVPGKKVTLTVGGNAVDLTTDATGTVTEQVPGTLTAGGYDLTGSFGGDDTLQKADGSGHVDVSRAPSTTTVTSAKSGKSILVKAQLLDDSRQPLAGQVITWSVNGKASKTTRTDNAGRCSFTTKPGHTVGAAFGGIPGRYSGSQASKRI